MKIISVIVDELPEGCGKCDHECKLWISLIDNIHTSRHEDCPLRDMPSDAEILEKVAVQDQTDYYCAGKMDGIKWLKSKLT